MLWEVNFDSEECQSFFERTIVVKFNNEHCLEILIILFHKASVLQNDRSFLIMSIKKSMNPLMAHWDSY